MQAGFGVWERGVSHSMAACAKGTRVPSQSTTDSVPFGCFLQTLPAREGVDDNIVLGFNFVLPGMMELPAQLVLRGLDSRQQLLDTSIIISGQQRRSTVYLSVGRAGSENVYVVTLFKYPWPVCPPSSTLLSSHGGRSDGRNRCSSSVWKRLSTNAYASGEAQTIEQLWEEYFADPSQWWDNRVDKNNPRSPDFKHKVTRKALWVDGWSNPPWVKAMLKLVTRGKLQPHVGYRAGGSHGTAQPSRLPKNNNGTRNPRPTSTRELRQNAQVGEPGMHLQNASTTSEAVAILKIHVGQGITIDSYMYVEVLERCFKQKDFLSAKQVHDCIMKSGMEQHTYVANNLLRVYIRCGRLQDARRVFDKLVKKNVFSWNILIGGYAQHDYAEDAMEVFNQMCQEGAQPDEITYLNILKACASPVGLKWGKEVHAHISTGGFDSDVRVGTALLKMYAKNGSIDDARLVFDRMLDRNVVTWTVMIGGLAQNGFGHEAFSLFLQMQKGGFVPNAITYVSILSACASAVALEWVKEVHSHALRAGLESDVRVGTALVQMYGKSGSIDDARLVFDRMVERDIVTWNVMLGGLAQQGFGHEAFSLFLQMQRGGFVPNAITYVNILSACASVGVLDWVKEVHSHALRAGLESDVRVGTALVHMYAKSGSIDDARLIFDRMVERNVVTWNVMIGGLAQQGFGHEAFSLFLQMQRGGFVPDAITYLSILGARASAGALDWVKEVHSHALRAGLESDVRVGTALVHMFAKSGSVDDARLVFDRMVERHVVTWTVMIGGLAQQGFGHEAFSLFLQMQRGGFVPNAITYLSILNACASIGDLDWVKDVHSHALRAGLETDVRVGNALVDMYGNSGSIDDARLVFDRMVERDVVTWNVMIGGLAQRGLAHEAFSLFLQMQKGGFVPDAITYVSILSAYASAGALDWVKEVHSHALRAGLESDVRVGTALVQMYGKRGSIDDARLVFDRMVQRDVVSWNVMIGGLAHQGFGHEAFSLFLQMQRGGFVPDAITYLSILGACASAGALEWVKEVHSHALRAGLESDVRLGTALVHMYAKSGSIDDARLIFDRMVERNVVTWNVMIGGLAQHGCGHEALLLFGQMDEEGVRPNGVTFVATLSACSHVGLVDEGRHQFLAMTQDYGIKPTIEHYTCMVDLLGRAGQLEEAKLFISNMPLEPDGATWGSLLGACRTYGNMELAEFAAHECLKLEPKNAVAYVVLSNIYAAAGNWDQVSSVRSMMQSRGIHKEPGRSWIEVDNEIHRFVVGDTSHPEAKEIYAELNILTKKIKAEGYIPDTRLVLHNTDEEDKELALCSHSEKLAIAYGLMHTAPGNPIRIYKNLRVCSDCHTATKFISKVTGREIVARDANRFHHFKDGVCSCGDYW